eukprot:13884942-Alexandrium_andersonii.AAC.1
MVAPAARLGHSCRRAAAAPVDARALRVNGGVHEEGAEPLSKGLKSSGARSTGTASAAREVSSSAEA